MDSDSQRLLSYIPEPLRRSANLTHVTPWSEPLQGAVLFADISGFTAITERAAQQGPEGAEQLSGLLYTLFGRIASLVYEHGGDVLEYAGDAVIAIFQSGVDGVEIALLRAAYCARTLPSVVSQATNTVDLNLSMRIGIGAGHLLAAGVGGSFGRRMYVVAGTPLDEAADACGVAAPNEVILSYWARMLISERAKVKTLADGRGRLKVVKKIPSLSRPSPQPQTASATEELRHYVLDCVQQRNSETQASWLAEFRHVSILFIAIDGMDYEQPDFVCILHEAVQRLQEVVSHFEGEIVQLLADDKGTVLLAAWGVPGFTHEDDAWRSVEAATKMREVLERIGLLGRIGLTRGQVFCGARGGDRRRDYAMLGNKVNLAARLMQHATKSVLCDQATVSACKYRYLFKPDTVIVAKGFKEPIPTFRPVAQREKQIPVENGLIGRLQECEYLAVLFQERAGHHGVVLEGEAGIGKSALVGYAIQAAKYSVVRCLVGIADVNEKSTPYYTWRTILAAVLGTEGIESKAVHGLLQTQLADDPALAAHSSLLGSVLGLDIPESEHTLQLTAARRAEIVRDQVVSLLRKYGDERPLLLILDDVHWMDSASWGLTRTVFERIDGIRLLLATRPMPIAETEDFTELRHLPSVENITLQSLQGDDILKLAARHLSIDSLPPELVDFVELKSNGNPFFVQELVTSLAEQGHIKVANGTCEVVNDLASLHVPDTVQGVVASRIDRLNSDLQLTLKVASVIGRIFAYRTVRDVHPVVALRSSVRKHLEQLESLDVTQLEAQHPELSYLFRHAITQEVTYDQLSFAQRRSLHAAVAEWFENHNAAEHAANYPLLAHHWARAKESLRAIAYLQLAGEQAVTAYANQEAIRFFDEAESLAADDKVAVDLVDRSRWQWLSGRAYLQLADNASSRNHLHRSLDLLGQKVPSTRIGNVIGLLIQIARISLGRPIDYRRGNAAAEIHPVLVQAAGVHHDLGEIAYFDNDLLSLAFSAARSINLATATGDDAVVARSLTTATVAVANAGLNTLARRYRDRAVAAAERTHDNFARAYCFMGCGLFHQAFGEWQVLEELLTEAAQIFERIGDRYRWEMTTNQHAYALIHQGYFDRARDMLERALRSANIDDTLQVPIIAISGLLMIGLVDGDVDQSRLAQLKQLAVRADQMAQPSDSILASGVIALSELHSGNLVAAKAIAHKAAKRVSFRPPPSFYTCRSLAAVTEVYLEDCRRARAGNSSGRVRRADRAVHGGLKALARFADFFPFAQPRLLRLRGDFEMLKDRSQAARDFFDAALLASEQLAMPYESKLTRAALASTRSSPTQH